MRYPRELRWTRLIVVWIAEESFIPLFFIHFFVVKEPLAHSMWVNNLGVDEVHPSLSGLLRYPPGLFRLSHQALLFHVAEYRKAAIEGTGSRANDFLH